MISIGTMVTTEVGIDQERDHSQETIVVIELEVQATVGRGQNPEPVQGGKGIYGPDFVSMPHRLHEEYLNVYESIQHSKYYKI